MHDGHLGIENSQKNSVKSRDFKLVLSYLKQGDGSGEFIIHATSTAMYIGGVVLQPLDFLANIGFTKYLGGCQFHGDRCFYRVIATIKKSEHGFEFHEQVQSIHRGFMSFAEKIGELYDVRQKEYSIINEIGLKPQIRGTLPAPLELEITSKDVPTWVQGEKFERLLELEAQKDKIQNEIEFYSSFLPLLYSTGKTLENAVVHALRFLGLRAEKAEKGFTVDVFAETVNEDKKFGFEITGINEAVKKSSNKLTQVLEFERIKEHGEKTILLANTHNGSPIPERARLESFTQPVVDFLSKHSILLMTSLDLYRMIKDVLNQTCSKESVIERLYSEVGVFIYPVNGG